MAFLAWKGAPARVDIIAGTFNPQYVLQLVLRNVFSGIVRVCPQQPPGYTSRRGRCALDKCYAYSSGARRRESVTEQQATEQQASREAHLNTNGRKGNRSSVRSDTQGVAGKTAGSRTYAQMDTRGTIPAGSLSITPYNKFTGRYGTICDGGPTGSNIAPRQPTLKSDSSGTITSVMYCTP